MIHTFGDLELDLNLFQVRCAGEEVRIRRQTFEVLAYLVGHRDRIVSKEEFLDEVWSDRFVSESTLANCISELRAALHDDSGSPQIIQTVYGRGYRFIASVEPDIEVHLAGPVESEAPARLCAEKPADPAWAAERVRSTFVGRERELEHLGVALDAAERGRGRCVLLVGEPGIGKTRTAERFADRARERGARVAIGRCDETEGIPSYWPWVQILRTCTFDHPRGPLAAEVAGLVSERETTSLETCAAGGGDPGTARFRLFESVAGFLVDLSQEAPLLIVVDDLHCADELSLGLLGFLTRRLSGSRLCIVCTYRASAVGRAPAHPLARFLGELTREGTADTLLLQPLDEAELTRFIELVSPDPLGAGLCAWIYEKTEGNPLFVAELIRFLRSTPEGPASRVKRAREIPLGVPAGLRSTIGLRLDELGADCRRLLEIASAVGREFRPTLLQRVTKRESRACLNCLQEAIDAGVLLEVPDESGIHAAGLFRFSHALIREVVYEALALGDRVGIHRRIAATLEDLHSAGHGERAAAIGRHYAQSSDPGDLQKAVTYYRRAGVDAARRLAHHQAVGHFEAALAALDRLGTADEKKTCDLLLAQAGALRWTHQYARLKETLLRVIHLARRIPDVDRLAGAALLWGGVDTLGAFDETWIELLEEALRGSAAKDSHLRAALLALLVVARFPVDSPEQSLALNQQALAMCRRLSDRRGQALGLSLRSSFLLGPDRFDESCSLADDSLALAVDVCDLSVELIARGSRLRKKLESADAADLDAEIATLERVAGQPDNGVLLTVRGTVALLQGRYDEAESILARNHGDRFLATPDGVCPPSFVCPMFALLRDRGRLAELEATLRSAAARSPSFPLWRILLATLLAETQRSATARRELDEMARRGFESLPRNGLWLANVVHLADLAAELGEAGHAAELHAMLEPFAGRVATVAGLVCVGPVCLALGRLEVVLGEWSEADRNLRRALLHAERLGARPLVARAQTHCAAMLLGRRGAGDLVHASSVLKQARITVDEIGLHGALEERLRALEASLRSSGD